MNTPPPEPFTNPSNPSWARAGKTFTARKCAANTPDVPPGGMGHLWDIWDIDLPRLPRVARGKSAPICLSPLGMFRTGQATQGGAYRASRQKLDYGKWEIVASRYYEIPADALSAPGGTK